MLGCLTSNYAPALDKKNRDTQLKAHIEICQNQAKVFYLPTLISLINVELGINVEGVQKLPNH